MESAVGIRLTSYDGRAVRGVFDPPPNPTVRADRDLVNAFRDLPAYAHDAASFTFDLNVDSAVFLQSLGARVAYADLNAEIACKTYCMLHQQAIMRGEIINAYREHKKVSPTNYPFKREPMLHQRAGHAVVLNSQFLAVFCEMGTGKTKIMIDALCAMATEHKKTCPTRPFTALIVAPRSVMLNWIHELEFDCTAPYRVALLSHLSRRTQAELAAKNVVAAGGGEAGGVETLLQLISHRDVDLQVAITSYGALKAQLPALKMMRWDAAVLDESHNIKSPTAKRTKLAVELADACQRRYILTGTPLTQNPLDFFSQFEFLGPRLSLLGAATFYGYQALYQDRQRYGGYEKTVGWKASGKLLERVGRWSFVVRKEECLDLPPKVYDCRYVMMSEEQAEIYEQVTEEVLLELESLGAEVTIQNILVQYLRLAQVTSGFIKAVDGKNHVIPGAGGKIQETVEIIREHPEQKVIVWARFIHEIELICAALTEAGIAHVSLTGATGIEDRAAAVKAFNEDPAVRAFVGSAASGGEGVNLTAASLVIYVTNDFSLKNRLQSEDRAHRKGQTRSVLYLDVLMKDTIDEFVLKRLNEKRGLVDQFTDPAEIARSFISFLRGT